MDNKIFLKRPSKPAIEIQFSTARHGNNAFLYLYSGGDIIAAIATHNTKSLSYELRRAAELLDERSVAEMESGIIKSEQAIELDHWQRRVDPRTLTPAQVIAYFEQSPHLAAMADDVRAALDKYIFEPASSELDRDLDQCRPHLAKLTGPDGLQLWGAQSRVAEILKIQNAGSHRKRIEAVLAALKNSTTTIVMETIPAMAA